MTNVPAPRIALGLIIAILVLAVDQLSKWYLLAVVDMPARQVIEVTSFFNLAMVWNKGVSFGMLAAQDMPLVLAGIAIVASFILFLWLRKTPEPLLAVAIGLVIGGALANAIDRFRYGAVADFFDAHLLGYHWPAFNVADSAIFIGVVLLLRDAMLNPSRKG